MVLSGAVPGHQKPPDAVRTRFGWVIIRRAEPTDLVDVAAIAEASWEAAYAGLLKPGTGSAWVETVYSPAALRQRWEDHPIYLVVEKQRIIAFADAFIEDDQIVLSAICTDPAYRRRGAAGMLVEWIQAMSPQLPIIADVVLGSHAAESFYEAKGFVPGETMQVTLFGERIIERRWWLGASLQAAAEDGKRAGGYRG
jgi:GNAT superfamily N-acetyltransferase